MSEKRDLAATRRLLTSALEHSPRPTEVSTDRAAAYPRVLDELLPPLSWRGPVRQQSNRSRPGRLKSRLRLPTSVIDGALARALAHAPPQPVAPAAEAPTSPAPNPPRRASGRGAAHRVLQHRNPSFLRPARPVGLRYVGPIDIIEIDETTLRIYGDQDLRGLQPDLTPSRGVGALRTTPLAHERTTGTFPQRGTMTRCCGAPSRGQVVIDPHTVRYAASRSRSNGSPASAATRLGGADYIVSE